jgi:hypothetical protein
VTITITRATRKNSTIRRTFGIAQAARHAMLNPPGTPFRARKLIKYIAVRWCVQAQGCKCKCKCK